MKKIYREQRVPLVRMILIEHPFCQRCLMKASTDPHELVPRGRGGSITDKTNLVALCRDCHSWIHGHPIQATREGWLRKNGQRA